MSYFDKSVYERKSDWAGKKNNEECEKGMKNGMTAEQAEAMKRLCADRHYIHTHAEELFYEESADYPRVTGLLDPDCGSTTESIWEYLKSAGFDNNLFADTSVLDDDHTYNQYEDSAEKNDEKMRQKALSECYVFIEKMNSKIENFMRSIDEKFGTEFCPSGKARAAGIDPEIKERY